ncbi:MAG: imidazole glycerol phosphate synthase subunit HisH [Treponema sp.]|nr:imidazole glycerol phosphate synthase subunit HisH [Treponema sp.]
MTGIVDYNAGNIKSVERALSALGAPFILSKSPKDLESCDRLIFPGVGDAAYAMAQLKESGFDVFLKEWALSQKPLVGICLGSQIVFDYSEEGNVECLGLLHGKIRHFSAVWHDEKSVAAGLKIPQIGWNNLSYMNGSSPLFDGIPENKDFYFVHSYLIQPDDEKIIKAAVDYGCRVPACVSQGSVTAFQFHPEKSGRWGLKILENFVRDDLKGN